MISYTDKQLLAFIRGSDYAHAGEEEAIDLALRPVPRRPDQLLLDVGCGLGGTAKYVEDLTGAYNRWYDSLLKRLDAKRPQIIDAVGAEGFNFVRSTYAGLLGAIRRGSLGGAIVRARRSGGEALS
jgi:hypothetical protein